MGPKKYSPLEDISWDLELLAEKYGDVELWNRDMNNDVSDVEMAKDTEQNEDERAERGDTRRKRVIFYIGSEPPTPEASEDESDQLEIEEYNGFCHSK